MPDDDSDKTMDSIEFTRRSTLLGVGGLASMGEIFSRNINQTEVEQSESPQIGGQTDFSASVDEGLPGDKFGKIGIGKYTHSLQVSGTRWPAWMIQPFNEDVCISSTTYKGVGSNIGYGLIPFPPGQVPVLRVVGHFDNQPESTTSLRVSIANRPVSSTQGTPLDDGEVKQTILEVTGKGRTQVHNEVYLSDYDDIVLGQSNGSSLPKNTFIIEAKADASKKEATISSATTVSLELEAL